MNFTGKTCIMSTCQQSGVEILSLSLKGKCQLSGSYNTKLDEVAVPSRGWRWG